MEEIKITCSHCGAEITNDDYSTVNGQIVCSDCVDHYCCTCDRCGATIFDCDSHGDEYTNLCHSCFSNFYLLNIIDVLQSKGVTLVSSKENIDTNTLQGRFVLSIFAALSELEREQTLQRQCEGIAIAKSQGKYKGRQPIAIDWDKFGQMYDMWKSQVITAVEFQKQMGLRANTFYRRIREYESKL